MADYEFTTSWFQSAAKPVWDQLVPQIGPKAILEIGSYEGASACYLIDQLASKHDIEIHCIDTWEGGLEHQSSGAAAVNMTDVEARFHRNVKQAIAAATSKVDLRIHKGFSDQKLADLLSGGRAGTFDFVYIDGSHQAPDVLSDAVLSFKLLRVGGMMVFDDYLWAEPLPYGRDPLRCPKPAIDAFTNLYCRKVQVLSAPLYQLYAQKISD